MFLLGGGEPGTDHLSPPTPSPADTAQHRDMLTVVTPSRDMTKSNRHQLAAQWPPPTMCACFAVPSHGLLVDQGGGKAGTPLPSHSSAMENQGTAPPALILLSVTHSGQKCKSRSVKASGSVLAPQPHACSLFHMLFLLGQ